MESLRQVEVFPSLRIKGAKEPKLVLDDGAADVAADIRFRESIAGRSCKREVLHVTDQAFGCSIAKNVAVKFIATTLGDDVEDTDRGLAVLGAVSTGFDFDFLNKLKRKVGARSAESGVGGIHAVQNVVVLRSRRSGNRRIAITTGRIAQTRPGNGRSDCVKTLHRALSREVRKLLGRNIRPGGVRCQIDLGSAGDRYGRRGRCQVELRVNCGSFSQVD